MHRSFLIISILGLGASTLSGCSDWTYGRTLEGEVVNTGSRAKGSSSGGFDDKVSLIVKADPANLDSKIKETTCGPSGCAIECLSTRCASIQIGTCHRFKCKFDHREAIFYGGEPNVIECKHDKEIECAKVPEPG